MKQCFAIWKQDTEEKPGRTSLLNFVGPAVLLTLEEAWRRDTCTRTHTYTHNAHTHTRTHAH